MFAFFRQRIRHPFFPDLAAVPAAKARGVPAAIAGTFEELLRAARRGVRARRAIFVVVTERAWSEDQRDELWRLFQVPVYGMVLDGRQVVAWECEAQDGMHAAGAGGVECACGRAGPRIAIGEMQTEAVSAIVSAGND